MQALLFSEIFLCFYLKVEVLFLLLTRWNAAVVPVSVNNREAKSERKSRLHEQGAAGTGGVLQHEQVCRQIRTIRTLTIIVKIRIVEKQASKSSSKHNS